MKIQTVIRCGAAWLLTSVLSSAASAAGGVLPSISLPQPTAAGVSGDHIPAPDIEARQAPEGAPNVVVVLLDDVGFGAAETFGGLIETPSMNELADQGLSYTRFHTTGICSPTRASLLTGRNPHAAGMGIVMNTATNHPGYRGVLADETATVAEVLRQNGYATSAWGKWHLTPDWEASQVGPFDRWPTGVGFERFYGFMGGETDQFEPTLYDGTTPQIMPRDEDYHLTEDMADRAIEWMSLQTSVNPDRPFFVYFAPGATHAPLQAPKAWIDAYRGKFDQGWDRLRELVFERQKKLGVIPEDTELTPRPDKLPAWDSLSADEQRAASRLMEVYAGFLAHTDAQVGRLAKALKELDEFDNTLFIYIVGDNGASAEGGIGGSANYFGDLQGLGAGLQDTLKNLDRMGGPETYPHFSSAWAWAINTPFQWTKQIASHFGGTRNPMVVTWPEGIKRDGEVRQHFSHVNDIVPTILEAAGIDAPAMVNGKPQRQMDGTSLLYSFNDRDAEERHQTQYFEVYGNRAIYHQGWVASAFRGRVPWEVFYRAHNDDFSADRWELYHVEQDFSQAHDLANEYPEKLAEMKALFIAEAAKNQVLPLHNRNDQNRRLPSLVEGRNEFTYRGGIFGIPESSAPNTRSRSHTLEAEIVIDADTAQGVVATMGGRSAGWSLYLDEQSRPVYIYKLFNREQMRIESPQPLGKGRHTIRYQFEKQGKSPLAGGEGILKVNGKVVGRGTLKQTAPAFFTIDETFDIGLDTGSGVDHYRAPFRFTGEVESFGVELD